MSIKFKYDNKYVIIKNTDSIELEEKKDIIYIKCLNSNETYKIKKDRIILEELLELINNDVMHEIDLKIWQPSASLVFV